jgi:type I restriction enzyme, S subunit
MSSESKTPTEKERGVGWVSPQGITQRSGVEAEAGEEFENVGLRPKGVPVGRGASPTYGLYSRVYKSSRLDDVAEIVDSLHKTPIYASQGFPMVRVTDVKYGYLSLSGCLCVDEAVYSEFSRRFKPKFGDIVMTRVGTYGVSAIVKDTNFCLGQNTVAIIPTDISCRYLYAALNSEIVLSQIEAGVVGSTQKTLSLKNIKALEIPRHGELIEQEISALISALDDRITLLRETNATLEAIAQALFKSWFVDFDPVHAKMQAAAQARAHANPESAPDPSPICPPESPAPEKTNTTANIPALAGMDPQTLSLFPDSLQDSELGLIPKGWKLVPFGELLAHAIGGDWGDEHPNDTNDTRVAIIRGTDIPDLQQGGANRVPIRFTSTKKLLTRMLKDGDLVIEVSGGSKDQPTGRALYLTELMLAQFDCPVEPASFCRLLRPIDKDIGVLLAQHLIYIYSIGKTWEYQNQSTGIANFQTTHFLESELVAVPSAEVLTAFTEVVRPIIERAHLSQVHALTQLRDTLLPRLISGQLRLPDAEAQIEAVLA